MCTLTPPPPSPIYFVTYYKGQRKVCPCISRYIFTNRTHLYKHAAPRSGRHITSTLNAPTPPWPFSASHSVTHSASLQAHRPLQPLLQRPHCRQSPHAERPCTQPLGSSPHRYPSALAPGCQACSQRLSSPPGRTPARSPHEPAP